MNYLTGTTSDVETQTPARIKSVTVTAGAGGAGTLTIYPYNDSSYGQPLEVSAPANTTIQVSWEGLPYLTGILADPGTNVSSFVVEYESAG